MSHGFSNSENHTLADDNSDIDSILFSEDAPFFDSLLYMDLEGLMFLVLDNHKLLSVRDLIQMCCFRNMELSFIIEKLVNTLNLYNIHSTDFVPYFKKLIKTSPTPEKNEYYTSVLESVLRDLRELSPINRECISESDLFFTAKKTHTCDVCEELIEPGDEIYIRTKPCNTFRHKKCNSSIRFSYEYAMIEYYLKEIEFFEKELVSKENTEHRLDGPLKHTVFYKNGWMTDADEIITKIPDFVDFVSDYTSGESDYTLMTKYRPYHLYIELFLKMKGLNINQIKSMGGNKFILREKINEHHYADLNKSIERTNYSELMEYEEVYSYIDSNVKNAIYSEVLRKMFSDLNMLNEDGTLNYSNSKISYSLDKNEECDIWITFENSELLCVDSTSVQTVADYFDIDPSTIEKYITYMHNFEV